MESPFQFCQDSWLLALHSLQRMGWVNLESNVVISGSMIASCETVSLWLRAMELLQYPSIIGCLALNVANPCAKTTQWYHYSIKDGDPFYNRVTRMQKVNSASSWSFEQKVVYPASLSLGDISQLMITYVSRSHQHCFFFFPKRIQ